MHVGHPGNVDIGWTVTRTQIKRSMKLLPRFPKKRLSEFFSKPIPPYVRLLKTASLTAGEYPPPQSRVLEKLKLVTSY